jgi:hypothetical protein
MFGSGPNGEGVGEPGGGVGDDGSSGI